MRLLGNTKVGTLLLTSFIGLGLLSLAVSGLGLFNMRALSQANHVMFEQELMGLAHAKDVHIEMLAVGRELRNAALSTSQAERTAALATMREHMQRMKSGVAAARPLYYSERGRELFGRLERELVGFDAALVGTAALLATEESQDERASTRALFGQYAGQVAAVERIVQALAATKQSNAQEAYTAGNARYATSAALMLGLVAAALVIGVLLGITVTRTITGQLGGEPRDVARLAHRIAGGDLSERVVQRVRDPRSLLAAMQGMRDNLVRIVSGVRGNAEAVAAATEQMAQGNSDLSARTEQQAGALEQTAASMEQLSASVRLNAENAAQANRLSLGASSVAERCGQVVTDVVATMRDINDSSRRVADIVGVIDGIAFQTNLLALNAAVEAARAGEQGRGFAVVAGEVRSLARRSAAAAKEIKSLIAASVQRVEDGTALVDKAGATMNEVVQSIRRVSDIVGEISAASTEQSQGVTEVGAAMTQMDNTTQQNAALVEELTAASENLRREAEALMQAISVFRLPELAAAQPAVPPDTRAAPPAPAPAGRPGGLRVAGPRSQQLTHTAEFRARLASSGAQRPGV